MQEKPVLLSTLLNVDLGFLLQFADRKPPSGQGRSTGRVEKKEEGPVLTHKRPDQISSSRGPLTPPGANSIPKLFVPHAAKNGTGTAHYLLSGNSTVSEGSPEREVEKPTSFSASYSGYATSGMFMFSDLGEP